MGWGIKYIYNVRSRLELRQWRSLLLQALTGSCQVVRQPDNYNSVNYSRVCIQATSSTVEGGGVWRRFYFSHLVPNNLKEASGGVYQNRYRVKHFFLSVLQLLSLPGFLLLLFLILFTLLFMPRFILIFNFVSIIFSLTWSSSYCFSFFFTP